MPLDPAQQPRKKISPVMKTVLIAIPLAMLIALVAIIIIGLNMASTQPTPDDDPVPGMQLFVTETPRAPEPLSR